MAWGLKSFANCLISSILLNKLLQLRWAKWSPFLLKISDSSFNEMFWTCSSRIKNSSSVSVSKPVSAKGSASISILVSAGEAKDRAEDEPDEIEADEGEDEVGGVGNKADEEGEAVVEDEAADEAADVFWEPLHTVHVKFRLAAFDRVINCDLLNPSHLEWIHLLHEVQ